MIWVSPQAERGPGRLSSPMLVVLAIVLACAAGGLLLGPDGIAFVLFVGPWAAVVLLAEFQYLGPRRLAAETIENSLAAGRCPACLYSLEDLPSATDGCVMCPE